MNGIDRMTCTGCKGVPFPNFPAFRVTLCNTDSQMQSFGECRLQLFLALHQSFLAQCVNWCRYLYKFFIPNVQVFLPLYFSMNFSGRIRMPKRPSKLAWTQMYILAQSQYIVSLGTRHGSFRKVLVDWWPCSEFYDRCKT